MKMHNALPGNGSAVPDTALELRNFMIGTPPHSSRARLDTPSFQKRVLSVFFQKKKKGRVQLKVEQNAAGLLFWGVSMKFKTFQKPLKLPKK